MKNGNWNPRGPKWGPLMPSLTPDSSNFPQDMSQGGGHSFLSRANAPPHLKSGRDFNSPRRRGQNSHPQNGAGGQHDHEQWGTPSPPGVSPRGRNAHNQQQRRGFRTSPNVHGGHSSTPPMPPGHLNGMVWGPSVPIQISPNGFPLNDRNQNGQGRRAMMMSSPEVPSFSRSWAEGPPVNHFDIVGLSPGEDRLSYADRLATRMYNEMLAEKKGVSSLKVAQATLSALGVPAFEVLGIKLQDVTCLRQLTTLESRVNLFIQSYLSARKIATLYDLGYDLASEEGVNDYEDLGLGPLLCHELVIQNFSPPVGVEMNKITAMDVIQHLADWIDDHPKDVLKVESFVSYVASQLSLASPEHLLIRIQSLGMHVGLIKRAKKAETERIVTWERRAKAEFAKRNRDSVMGRVSSFLAAEREKETSVRKRKRFASSPELDDDTGDEDSVDGVPQRLLQDSAPRRKVKLDDASTVAVSSAAPSCPYPSAAEERARVKKLELQQFVANSENEDFYLSRPELQEFVTILKDACHNRSVHEVLMKMIEMSRKFKGTKKRSGKSKIFKAYPAIGLLNVAVLSVKAGFWDSMYQNLLEDETDGPLKDKMRTAQVAAPIDVASAKQSAQSKASPLPAPEEIVAAVSEHFETNLRPKIVDGGQTQHKSWWSFVHWVHECEDWINGKYSVGEFASLGYGKFSNFLEQYIELLPSWVISIIGEKARHRRLLEAKVPKERLFSFLAQALPTALENGSPLEDHISGLLYRQFNVSSVEELGASSVENLLETSKGDASRVTPNDHVIFLEPLVASGTTIGTGAPGQFTEKSTQAELSDVAPELRVGVLGSMTSADAAKCLLKAPFLVDLSQWSQWQSVFAPTLGTLPDWFEREGSKWGLQAIVTSQEALLRIDGKATPDNFLLATVKGLGDQMAAVLMSLIALYGGPTKTPTALLKSYASKGLDVLLGSSAGELTMQSPSRSPSPKMKRKFTEQSGGQVVKQNHSFRDVKSKTTNGLEASGSGNGIFQAGGISQASVAGRIGNQSLVASQCVLECLSCVIPEFRAFTAEILLPALSQLIAGVPALLLSICFTLQQKSTLHGLGFCLGIPEWVSDYNSVAFDPTQSAPSDMCAPEEMDVDSSNHGLLEKEVADETLTFNKRAVVTNGVEVDTKDGCKDVVISSDNLPSTFDTDRSQGSPQHSSPDGSKRLGKTNSKGRKAKARKDTLPERASVEAEATMVIEEIRQNEFGVGQDIQGKGCDLLARQHARMGRALHRLSSDLYSQDSHFVLELVQNADDNAYHQGVEAALLFLIQEGRIVVLNNEKGFTAANIRALCDVGNSTKAGMNVGYIGHKGIGFKSVFRVTDAPEIHSNGFHVKFDVSEGDLGFILPTCIPPPPAGDSSADIVALMPETEIPQRAVDFWNTRINLPIKASIRKGTGLNLLASKFSDLHPSLLLFLHRLRRIIIRNELTGSMVLMHREDKGEDLVKVVHGTGTATWMVVRQKLKAAVQRPGITETEIALAFQLKEVSSGTYEAHSEQQQVFAFLPLRSYGLRFILQGDFKVPSSREEVDCDSDWNQWLRSEIPNVFLKSSEFFQKTLAGGGSPGKAVSSFMSFVPMEGEVLGFFSPLPRMILSSLRGSACLPVEGGGWAIPCVLLRGWADSTRQLLPDMFLNNQLGLRYLDKEVNITDVLAMKLGVQQFGAGTLVAVMKSVCEKKGALMSLGIKWVQAWLLALHECLVSDKNSAHPGIYEDKWGSFRLELQSLPYIPLSNGTFTSLSVGSVWFAGELFENGLGVNSVLSNFKLLSSELRTIHPGLLTLTNEFGITGEGSGATSPLLNGGGFEKDRVGNVVSILQRLGVSRLSSHELLRSHVLPAMARDDCLLKDQLVVVEYLGFVISHLESNCVTCRSGDYNVKAELQKCAVLVTNHGLIRLGQKPIHFSSAMGNNISDMKMILEGSSLPWIEVSPLYLQLQGQGCELTQLRNFFKELGVTDFVKVVYMERTIVKKNASSWKNCLWEDSGASERPWVLQDCSSPELESLLKLKKTGGSASMEGQNNSLRVRQRCASILAALDRNWDDYYCQFCNASYSPLAVNGVSPQKATVSSFLLLLQQCSWIISSLDGNLHVPTDLFRPCEAVERILGSHAPYSVTPIQSTGCMEALGLRTQVMMDDALQLLRYWSQNKACFEASVQEMTRLYYFLWEKLPSHKEDVLNLFRSGESIFVPLQWNKNEQEVQKGRFYAVESLCWSDPTNTLDSLSFDQKMILCVPAAPLCGIYQGLHEFFVRECLVPEMPSFDGYLAIVKKIAAEQRPITALSHVMGVFSLWSSEISRRNVEPAEILRWKSRLGEAESRIFATNQDTWVSLSDQKGMVCICDDNKLGDEFQEFWGFVYFLLLTDDDLRETLKGSNSLKTDDCTLQPLVEALGIPKLSEVVERQVIKYGTRDSAKIETLIDWILLYAQCYLKHHHADQYKYLQGSGIKEALGRLKFMAVDRLFFRYSLRNTGIRSKRKSPCTSILEGNTLYVVEDFVNDYCNIYAELSRLFFSGKPNLQMANFLHLITLMASSGSSRNEIEGFIQNVQGIQPVMEGEDLWTLSNGVNGHPAAHLVGWPPKTWMPVPSASNERGGGVNRRSPGLSPLRCSQTQAAPLQGYDTGEYSTFKDSPSRDGPLRSIGEESAGTQLLFGDVKDFPSLLHTTPYPVSIEGKGKIHFAKALHYPEVQSPSPSQVLQSEYFIEEAHQSQAMDVQEVVVDGSDSMLVENTPQNRALANFQGRDSLGAHPVNEQQRETGRSGEALVYHYLSSHYGAAAHVKWLNQDSESGAAYDIVVIKDSGREEFVEVKATRSAGKDWFEISPYEWDFARSHPDSFSIIRVCLGSTSQQAKLLRLPNPVKLAQDRVLQLALLLPAVQDNTLRNL
ncbi:unnamed protein product [Calypogeia fissa]